MQSICDAPGQKSWFRIEAEGEAALKSQIVKHAIEKPFRQAHDAATKTYAPPSSLFIEQEIGLNAHVQRIMPLLLALRDYKGQAPATVTWPVQTARRLWRTTHPARLLCRTPLAFTSCRFTLPILSRA